MLQKRFSGFQGPSGFHEDLGSFRWFQWISGARQVVPMTMGLHRDSGTFRRVSVAFQKYFMSLQMFRMQFRNGVPDVFQGVSEDFKEILGKFQADTREISESFRP